jgi:hypothetical protein
MPRPALEAALPQDWALFPACRNLGGPPYLPRSWRTAGQESTARRPWTSYTNISDCTECEGRSIVIPLHPFGPLFLCRSDLAQLPSQYADSLHRCANVVGQVACYLPPDDVGQLGAVAVGADHDLQRPIAMHTAEVEVALGRHVGNVGRYPLLVTQLVDLGRGFGVVDGRQDHVDSFEIRRFEFAVHQLDLLLGDAVGHLVVQPGPGRDDGDFCVGVEHVHDAPGSNLHLQQSSKKSFPATAIEGLTSPPPTTRILLLRICQASRSEPPPWISG